MLVILFCNLVCVYIYRTPLTGVVLRLYVVVFIVKSKSKRSPGTDFAVEDMNIFE